MKYPIFIRQLIALRRHFRHDQKDWADHINKTRETFNRIENGTAPLSVVDLLTLAQECKIHPAAFFCFDPESNQVEYPTDAAFLKEITLLKKTNGHLLSRIGQLEGRGNLNSF